MHPIYLEGSSGTMSTFVNATSKILHFFASPWESDAFQLDSNPLYREYETRQKRHRVRPSCEMEGMGDSFNCDAFPAVIAICEQGDWNGQTITTSLCEMSLKGKGSWLALTPTRPELSLSLASVILAAVPILLLHTTIFGRLCGGQQRI